MCTEAATIRHNMDVLHTHLLACRATLVAEEGDEPAVRAFCTELAAQAAALQQKMLPHAPVRFGPVPLPKASLGDACTAEEAAFLAAEVKRITGTAMKPFTPASLLYRMTVHGKKVSDFHARCDKKKRLLIVAHGQNASGQKSVFGGFTAVGLNTALSAFQGDAHAFLFTLRSPSAVPKTIFTPSSPPDTVYSHNRNAIIFGNNDLWLGYAGGDKGEMEYCSTSFPSKFTDTSGKGKNVFFGADKCTIVDLWALEV